MSKKRKDSGNAKATEEDRIIGSEKCILKAVQLMATIDELEKRWIPERGWIDNELDEFVRARELDPFSQQQFSVEAMLPAEYGFKSLVCETFFSQALAWWAKAQHTNQQKDKYLLRKMYRSTSWYDHFMGRRNNIGSHLPNDELFRVPGARWLIARGYHPFGSAAIVAFKYMLSESMALLMPPQKKKETLRMCLGAFGIGHINISDLQVPDSTDAKVLSLVVLNPSPLLYHIIPLPNGNWVCEAWDADESSAIVPGGRHFGLPSELACRTPQEAFRVLSERISKEREAS